MHKNAIVLLFTSVLMGCSDPNAATPSTDPHKQEAQLLTTPEPENLPLRGNIPQPYPTALAIENRPDIPEFPEALLNASVPHDIDPSLFDRFWDTWQIVTTRWREDNKELRFTYANSLAWQSMKSGRLDYPIGSVITKMGVHVMEDPLFPNSQVPSRRVNRIQVMLKDPSHPKAARDGWVYSLYFPMKPDGVMIAKDINACASCHEKAKDRGYVFSLPMIVGRDFDKSSVSELDGDNFKLTTLDQLPELLKLSLPTTSKSSATAYLQQMALFNGSVNEYIPVIAKRVVATEAVQSIYDEYDGHYLVGYPDTRQKDCAFVIASRMSGIDSSSGGMQFARESNHFCHGNLVERKVIGKPMIPAIPGQPYPNQSLNIAH